MALLLLLAALAVGEIYDATVVRVIDGDTIRMVIFTPDGEIVTSIRVRDVDTPELRGKCAKEIELAYKAKTFVEELMPRATAVKLSRVAPERSGKRKTDRHLADVQMADGDLREILLASGHGRAWSGRHPRPNWCAG